MSRLAVLRGICAATATREAAGKRGGPGSTAGVVPEALVLPPCLIRLQHGALVPLAD